MSFVGMVAGIIFESLVEFGSRIFFGPAYGKLLLKRPLPALAILKDAEDLVGLSIRFAEDRKNLKITFENDEHARDFFALNPQEK